MQAVSILIVSWNTCAYLDRCLASIRQCRPACLHEVIVVDNDSFDGSPQMVQARYPEVRLIRAGSNLGFARANNLAIRQATGSLLALVNSDALVHPGCLEVLAQYLEQHPRVGLAGPRVIGGDGQLQRTCRNLPTLWNTLCRTLALDCVYVRSWHPGGYELTPAEHARRRDVEVLSACFCMARRAAIDQVGGLDEQFFFYGEDIDWCKRMKDAGWQLAYVPEAHATHFGGASTSNAPLHYSIEILRATLTYWRKHHGPAGRIVCRALLLAHHGMRLLVRSACRCVGLGSSAQIGHKIHEDLVCLRWLCTGKGVPALVSTSSAGRQP